MATSAEGRALTLMDEIGLRSDDLVLGVLEQSENCVKVLNPYGVLEYMNCGGLRALEIAHPQDVMGKMWWDLWPTASAPMIRRNFERAVARETVRFTAYCPTALGNMRRWDVQLKPLVGSLGHTVAVLCTSRDMTDIEEAA